MKEKENIEKKCIFAGVIEYRRDIAAFCKKGYFPNTKYAINPCMASSFGPTGHKDISAFTNIEKMDECPYKQSFKETIQK